MSIYLCTLPSPQLLAGLATSDATLGTRCSIIDLNYYMDLMTGTPLPTRDQYTIALCSRKLSTPYFVCYQALQD